MKTLDFSKRKPGLNKGLLIYHMFQRFENRNFVVEKSRTVHFEPETKKLPLALFKLATKDMSLKKLQEIKNKQLAAVEDILKCIEGKSNAEEIAHENVGKK